jgi:hypothetical protein
MANRSDRHFLKPGMRIRAREAVNLIRRKCADFHLGPGHSGIAPLRGRIYDCNRYIAHQTPEQCCAGERSIYDPRGFIAGFDRPRIKF